MHRAKSKKQGTPGFWHVARPSSLSCSHSSSVSVQYATWYSLIAAFNPEGIGARGGINRHQRTNGAATMDDRLSSGAPQTQNHTYAFSSELLKRTEIRAR